MEHLAVVALQVATNTEQVLDNTGFENIDWYGLADIFDYIT